MEADEDGVQLHKALARDLPEGCQFTIYHLSTPPTQTDRALFSRAPNGYEEETFCETQFLNVFIVRDSHPLLVFAIEVLIYTTAHLTTLFISKADSTGYLHLLGLPKNVPSPLRTLCTTFLLWLRLSRGRSDRKLVLSLFARAQDQYLFPGSKENSHKHVLDDRRLIKWWCKVVDPLMVKPGAKQEENAECLHGSAYLRIPGFNKQETQVFFPRTETSPQNAQQRWTFGDPLQQLARSAGLPERCLVPRFPDDPKARFLLDLDDELPETETEKESPLGPDGQILPSQEGAGRWRSVKSLEQFWDTMSYRQECAAGRLVGFLWVVFDPIVRPPHFESLGWDFVDRPSKEALQNPELSEDTAQYFSWSRGKALLSADDYKKVMDLLLSGDYENEEVAMKNSEDMIKLIDSLSDAKASRIVIGTNKTKLAAPIPTGSGVTPTVLNSGLFKKKKRPPEDEPSSAKLEQSVSGLQTVSETSIRKKLKSDDSPKDIVKPV